MAILLGFTCSFVACLLLAIFFKKFSFFCKDVHFGNVQNIHAKPIPRFGGIGILIGIIIATLFYWSSLQKSIIFLFISGLPFFIIGLVVDIHASLSAKKRLSLITFFSAISCILNNITINQVGIHRLDWLLINFYPISIALTTFAVCGLINAYNLIDGLNGLSSFNALICLSSVYIIGLLINDLLITQSLLMVISALCGFIVLNYPISKIFLGDAGAYFIGFLCAYFSIMLINNDQSASPFLALLINIYPITDTIYSIYRRTLHQATHYGAPDQLHMHSLIFYYLKTKNSSNGKDEINNAKATLYIAIPTISFISIGLIFYRSSLVLITLIFIYLFLYCLQYKNLVKFKKISQADLI